MGVQILRPGRRVHNVGMPRILRAGGGGGGLLSQAAIDSMVAWWKLDETSGDRADAHGSYTLTDVNTVGYGTGKQGNAADFETDNAESLTVSTSDIKYDSSADWWLVGWWNLESTGGAWVFAAKSYATSPGMRLQRSSGKLQITISDGSNNQVVINTSNSLLTSTWYFIAIRHDASTKTVYLDIRGGITESLSDTYPASLNDSSGDFSLGDTHGNASEFDGLIDEVAYGYDGWLSDDDITALYNSGSGITYEQATGN